MKKNLLRMDPRLLFLIALVLTIKSIVLYGFPCTMALGSAVKGFLLAEIWRE